MEQLHALLALATLALGGAALATLFAGGPPLRDCAHGRAALGLLLRGTGLLAGFYLLAGLHLDDFAACLLGFAPAWFEARRLRGGR